MIDSGRRAFFTKALGLARPRELPSARRKIISSGEPLGSSGAPFGGRVSGFACFPWGHDGRRAVLVVGHSGPLPARAEFLGEERAEKLKARGYGISVLELRRGGGANGVRSVWELVCDSVLARRFDPSTEEAVGPVSSVVATPWGTALAADASNGWIFEIDPFAGILVPRVRLARPGRANLRLEYVAGEKVRVQIATEWGERFVFESARVFNSRMPNKAILSAGELRIAESDGEECTDNPSELKIRLGTANIICTNSPAIAGVYCA